MRDCILVFSAQLVYVLLLGLQSLNVNSNRKAWAAGTSFMLGTFGYQITATIATHRGDALGPVWWSYVLAGPIGIVASMIVFHRGGKL